MLYEDFKRNLRRAGLSVAEFAELLRMRRQSISNYAKAGVVSDHLGLISVLLAEMALADLDIRAAVARAGLEPRESRGARRFGRDDDDAE